MGSILMITFQLSFHPTDPIFYIDIYFERGRRGDPLPFYIDTGRDRTITFNIHKNNIGYPKPTYLRVDLSGED